jgi:hypothetical protein
LTAAAFVGVVGCSDGSGAPVGGLREGSVSAALGDATHLEGILRSYVIEAQDGTSATGYVLALPSGEYVDLDFGALAPSHLNETVSIEIDPAASGARLIAAPMGKRAVRVARVTPHSAAVDPAYARARRPPPRPMVNPGAPVLAHVAIVLLDFDGVAPQSMTPDEARASAGRVHDYYQEISYGNWNFQADVYGPYRVPLPADCNLPTVDALARNAAAADGHTIPSDISVGVSMPSGTGLGCACGLAWVGDAPATGSPSIATTALWSGCQDDNGIAHEFGHNFGWSHASKAHCNGVAMRRDVYNACSVEEYGNHFNTMGNGLGHPNAFQKSTMGWLTGCNTVRVATDGDFELAPIQTSSNAVQALQIPTGDVNGGAPTYYYVEYRNPGDAKFNAEDGSTVRELGPGLHVSIGREFTSNDGDGRSLILDMSAGALADPGYVDPRLTPGRSFTDPDGRVTIRFESTSGDAARVHVSFPGGSAPGGRFNACIDGSLPAPVDPSKGVVTLYQDCGFSGGWGIALPVGDYDTAALVAAGAKDDDASSLWVAPGYEAVLFDGDGFSGTSVTITGSDSCLTAQSFNDKLSSLRIRAIAPPDAGAASPPDAAPDAGDDAAALPGDDASAAGDGALGLAEDGGAAVGDGGTPGARIGSPASGGCSTTGGEAGSPVVGLGLCALAMTFVVQRRRRRVGG